MIAYFQQTFHIFTDMNKKNVYVIGLMSGTSLDGLDLVYVQFDIESNYQFKILYAETLSYSDYWKEKLQFAINYDDEYLKELDIEYGAFLGKKTKEFIVKNKIKNLDFIASHGHTVFHQPENGITLQIGNGQMIANETNVTVVCDFRTQDVQLGGQGAPLVPIGDQLLFSEYDACVNLGGFTNISYELNGYRIAFDICPVNIVLNHFSRKLGYEFDDKGILASKGKIDNDLLDYLNELDYYKLDSPKSLGLEWVKESMFPVLNKIESEVDILRTYTEHSAMQIASNIQNLDKVLITGGGVFNDYLLSRIKHYTETEVVVPNNQIINYKEALIFALLGLLKMQKKVNCLSSVTGAEKNHSSGVIFNPNNS